MIHSKTKERLDRFTKVFLLVFSRYIRRPCAGDVSLPMFQNELGVSVFLSFECSSKVSQGVNNGSIWTIY